ncbi:MAG: phosphoglycerate mutase family protein [Lachnospiraceae bacterium]|nr:phosphoglycerate mutase family protein [Lachnospiraceae bacterium]
MKIMIIRHGDPDYEHDTLTEKGWREARALADQLERLPMDAVYVSPLGRAKDTAAPTLERKGMEAVTCDWLREFWPRIHRGSEGPDRIVWDWLPAEWTQEERYFERNRWMDTEVMEEGGVGESYRYVTESFDRALASHGYVREGAFYRVERANNDTIVFFCHFGLESVLLSHLLNVSPMIVWHGFCAAPTSVTVLRSEERREGSAYFRMSNFGDTSHLYAAGEPEAESARFCECFMNMDERHD